MRPARADYAPFNAGYVDLVPEADILPVLVAQLGDVRDFFGRVPADGETYRYAPDKWSIRQVLGHMTDGDRVFGHRAFCIARGDQAALPGYDEQEYMAQSNFDTRELADLIDEFVAVRAVNLAVLRQLDAAGWQRRGTANDAPVTVLALAFMMAGHVRHHLRVLETRYVQEPA
jgi:hypothetical protein